MGVGNRWMWVALDRLLWGALGKANVQKNQWTSLD